MVHATRDRLVEAGVAALRELTVADLVSAVGTRSIAKRAGVSSTAFFHHFPSTAVFGEAVLARVYDPRLPLPSEVEIGSGIADIADSPLPLEISLRFHSAELTRVLDDPEHRLRVGLASLGGPAAESAYGNYLRERDAPLLPMAEQLYDSWGRELRPPLQWKAFVAVHAALLSGAGIRKRCDPEAFEIEAFAQSAASLTLSMVRLRGEGRGLPSKLAEINYFPVVSRADKRQRTLNVPVRDRLLDAAARLVAELGYDEVTLVQVARAARLSSSSAYSCFAGKSDLAAALLLRGLDGPLPAAGSVPTGRARLEQRLAQVAGLFHRRLPYVVPYAQQLLDVRPPSPDPLRATLHEAVTAAHDEGALRADVDPTFLTTSLLLVLATYVTAHPIDGPAAAVSHVVGMLLDGATLIPSADRSG